jgi:hypothetical protein
MQFMKEFNDKGDILMRHLRNIAETQPERSISLLEKFNHTALDVIASVRPLSVLVLLMYCCFFFCFLKGGVQHERGQC